jgi:hypothetical protein
MQSVPRFERVVMAQQTSSVEVMSSSSVKTITLTNRCWSKMHRARAPSRPSANLALGPVAVTMSGNSDAVAA